MNQNVGQSSPASKGPVSAGILLYQISSGQINVLLAHPGGPYFVRKDAGAWSIPKGLIEPNEQPEEAAVREFEEELGWRPAGELSPLGDVRLKSGKRLIAFAMLTLEATEDIVARFTPGTFEMEWPRGSGRMMSFPEVDRIAFYPIGTARVAINPSQLPLLERLIESRGHV